MDSESKREIEELIVRSLQAPLSRFEEERLRAWREASEGNEREFRELRDLWKLTGLASPPTDAEPPDFETVMAAADAADRMRHESDAPASKERRVQGSRKQKAPPKRTRWSASIRTRHIAGLVMTALAAGVAGIGFGVWTASEGSRPGLLEEGEVITGAGELTTVTLADGSTVRLGPESRLRIGQQEGRRVAWLEGRAFFGVQSDETRPFVVNTEMGEARALGTRFEVRTEDDEFRVLVVEGEVNVAAGGAEVRMTDGEMSRSPGGNRPSTEFVSDVYDHLDWLGNAIVFQATPLERAVRELERRYGVEMVIMEPSLRGLSVTATFTGRPVEEVVFVVCEIVGAACAVEGDRVLMDRSASAS